jgi:pyruvate ferredoxin oxidoreductase beta subunit
MEWGKVTSIQKIKKKIPVTDYLKSQKRFSHLFKKDQGDAELANIQAIANQHIEKFGLLARTKTGS